MVQYNSLYIPFFYEQDNNQFDLFPQVALNLYETSNALAQGVNLTSTLVIGHGFAQEGLNDLVVNRKGQTLLDIAKHCAQSLELFNGVTLHLTYNIFGKITEIYPLPFQLFRLATPSNYTLEPTHAYIKRYLMNFSDELKVFDFQLEKYPLWSEDFDLYKHFDGYIEDFEGVIYYQKNASPTTFFYPKPHWYSVIEDAKTNALIKESVRYDVEDRAKAQLLITKYTGVDDVPKAIEEKDKREFASFVEVDGGRVQILYAKNKESTPDIKELQPFDASKIYAFADESTQANIRKSFSLPQILYGIEVAGKLGTSKEFPHALAYATKIVVNPKQQAIERGLTKILKQSIYANTVTSTKLRDFSAADFETL